MPRIEGRGRRAPRRLPLFAAHPAGRLRFAVTTITIAEVLVGPLPAAGETLARRYRAVPGSWQTVVLDAEIAEGRRDCGLRFGSDGRMPFRPRAH